MLILYVAMKYDYGKPERGYSFEHYNFYDSLLHMGNDIIYFDFMTLMQRQGRDWMNRKLLDIVQSRKPDLLFSVLFTNELDQTVVRKITESTDTVTLNWFCDDHWRFDNFSRYWAPCFRWVVTTARSALPKYGRLGYQNVIKSQWACNHFLYQKLALPAIYDVTFIGQPHGDRRQLIQAVKDAGFNIEAWGTGWENGRLSQEKVIQVFNQSRINLNLSNASARVKGRRLLRARRLVSRSLDAIPFGDHARKFGKAWLSSTGHQDMSQHAIVDQLRAKYPEQIKARNFEVPGCGGFLMTTPAENLEDYYEIGREVICFESFYDLVDKIQYYLDHDGERVAIAQAGYLRTLEQHTYENRFREIFRRIGFPDEDIVKGAPGKREDVL
jgi:spore maturation protein CgeB